VLAELLTSIRKAKDTPLTKELNLLTDVPDVPTPDDKDEKGPTLKSLNNQEQVVERSGGDLRRVACRINAAKCKILSKVWRDFLGISVDGKKLKDKDGKCTGNTASKWDKHEDGGLKYGMKKATIQGYNTLWNLLKMYPALMDQSALPRQADYRIMVIWEDGTTRTNFGTYLRENEKNFDQKTLSALKNEDPMEEEEEEEQ